MKRVLLARRFASQCVQFEASGDVKSALKLANIVAREPKAQEVSVRLEAAAIHPADLAVVRGALPSVGNVAGSEGVGVVEKVGSGVSGLKAGDRVLVSGLGVGTWTQSGVFHENNVFALGKGLALEQAATLSSVCAAAVLLADFGASLKKGDVVLHVGSPGAVSLAFSQLAQKQNLKVISVIGNNVNTSDAVTLLKDHGSFATVTVPYLRSAAGRRLLSDLPKPALGLNGLGGAGATEVARLLAPGSTLVTYAGSSVHVPASLFVERGLRLEGFSLQRKFAQIGKTAAQAVVTQAEKAVTSGSVKLLLEVHKFSEFASAVQRQEEPGRNRKIILKM